MDYKIQLKEKCRSLIQERIDSLRMSMHAAQNAANEETKSSAGDKYETSRAMGHLEKDMYARQLAETGKEMASLMSIDCTVTNKTVQAGNMVLCDDISYFILAGIGKITFNGKLIYVISPNAPVAKLLIGKKAGDIVTIHKNTAQIIEIL
jgi:transcription elongation GreA/GreB family factor